MDANIVDLGELKLLLKRQKDLLFSAQFPSKYGVGNNTFYDKFILPLEQKLDRRFANTALPRKHNTIPLLLCVPGAIIPSREQYDLLGFPKNKGFQSYVRYVVGIHDVINDPSTEPYLLMNVDTSTLCNVTWVDALAKFPGAKNPPFLSFADGLMLATVIGRGMAQVPIRNQVALLRSTYAGDEIPYLDFGTTGLVVLNYVHQQNFKGGLRAAAFYEMIFTKQ